MVDKRQHGALQRLVCVARRHLPDLVVLVTNREAGRRAVIRDYVFRVAKYVTHSLTIKSGDAYFVLSTTDAVVSRVVFKHGSFDGALFERVFRALSAIQGRPFALRGTLFLDIGANIGSATVEACVHYGAAGGVAFEPEPTNFQYLKHNLIANHLEERVTVHRMAVSDRDGSATLELAGSLWGDHRVRSSASHGANVFGELDRQVISVPARKLDSLIDEGELAIEDIGLAWIDVQGHEASILAGATGLTASDVPVVIEYWPYGLRAAGGLEAMDSQISSHYTHYVDTHEQSVSESEPSVRPVRDLGQLRARYTEPEAHTNLILLKQ